MLKAKWYLDLSIVFWDVNKLFTKNNQDRSSKYSSPVKTIQIHTLVFKSVEIFCLTLNRKEKKGWNCVHYSTSECFLQDFCNTETTKKGSQYKLFNPVHWNFTKTSRSKT